MPSTHQTAVRVVNRGFNQGVQRHLLDAQFCWDLLNLEQVNGRLQQTPWLGSLVNTALLTGEAATSPVRMIRSVYSTSLGLKYLVLNETNARYVDITTPATQTLIPVVLQTAQPSNAGLTGQCLLYGINSTDFAATGDTIDVNIVTASTFRWRRNAGAWSASLPIQQSTTITVSGLAVSFQGQGDVTDYTNFTPGDTWTWTRLNTIPSPTANPTTANFTFSSDVYGQDVYIGGVSRNIMRLRNDFLTSVGYSRTYGMHVAVFFGHLFVSQFAQAGSGISDPYNSQTTPFTLGWSHLNNPDQFYSTLINEADQKLLPQQQFSDLANLGITGLAPWRSLLFVFLADSIWNFQYVGLPNVFQATQLNSNIGSIFRSGVIRTPQAIYFIGRNDFYKIEDFEPTAIGRAVRGKFFTEVCPINDTNFQRTFGYYNPIAKEVVWTYWIKVGALYQVRQVIYNEQTEDWHFRNVPCAASGYSDPYCATPIVNTSTSSVSLGQLNVFGYTGALYQDQAPGTTNNGLKDTFSGGSHLYTSPYFETPYLNYGNYFNIKQSDSLYIDASWLSGQHMHVYRAVQPYIGDGVANMSLLGQTWTQSLTDQRLSLPRDAYRSIAYKFEFTASNSNQAVYGAVFNLYQEFFIGPNQQVEK